MRVLVTIAVAATLASCTTPDAVRWARIDGRAIDDKTLSIAVSNCYAGPQSDREECMKRWGYAVAKN
jgi:hypothetical protein